MISVQLRNQIAGHFQRNVQLYAIFVFVVITLGISIYQNRPTLPGSRSNKSIDHSASVAPTTSRIEIERLSVKAPLFLDTPGTNESVYLKTLESGVAHYAGTSLPGETGNSFIFGHSDYDIRAAGEFKKVFQQLDKLQRNDTVVVYTLHDRFTYKVTDSKIVDDDDVSVLSQDTGGQAVVTLMTCWPPGSLEKRYVVTAVLEK